LQMDRLRLPRSLLLAIPLAVVCLPAARPQESPAPPAKLEAEFDVAAIHPHDPLPHEHSHIIDTNGRFVTVNVPLRAILEWAFDMPQSRIVDGPSWIRSARWDIEAKADDALDTQKTFDSNAAKRQKQQMVQALLKNRFNLAYHYETRVRPVYILAVAKDGPKFLTSQAKGTTINRGSTHIGVQGGDNTVALLAEQLAETLGRVVLDRTGIQGRYNIDLTWTPDDSTAPLPGSSGAPGSSGGASMAPVSSGPSIFTAIQEQLGLKLEPEKAPVNVLVVDRVNLPTPN
jgi:uncharacterized protein (TIGR03435 family)